MPAPFSPVHIPFISGARQDLGSIAQDNPAQLRQAENIVYTRKGQVTGRPALVFHEEQVETGGAGSVLQTSLLVANAGTPPSGLVSTGFSSGSGGDTPLACWQGASYYKRGTVWASAGPAWSMRQTKSAILKTYDPLSASRTNPVPVGQDIVGVVTTGGGGSGFPILNSSGEVSFISLGTLANYTPNAEANQVVAGNAIFWIDTTTGNVIGQIPGTLPAVTQVSHVVGASASASSSQRLAAVLDSGGFYYLAVLSATAGRITMLRLNAAGSITQTLNLNGLGTVQSLALMLDATHSRLGLAWNDIAAGPALKTKIITITAGVLADAALDLTLSGTPLNLLGLDVGSLAVGVTHTGQMSVLFTRNDGDLYVGGRSTIAAVESFFTRLVANGLAGEREWDPLFGGVVVGGRTLIGVMNSIDVFNQSSQWIVLDATALYQSGSIQLGPPVAAGPYLGAARMTPSSVYSTPTSVAFSVAEGLQFSGTERPVPTIRRAGIRRITLTTQATQAAHANGVTLLSGQLAHVFDGTSTHADHFAEEMPFVFNTTAAVAGGTLPAGSYTYQTTWEAVNAAGQVIRSGASNQRTLTGVLLNQKVNVVTSVPQIWSFNSQLDYIRVRLWATQVNPSPTAPLYFVTELAMNGTALFGSITLTHSAQAVGTEEQLYETRDTLSDMRAPGADRGIALAGERAWVADQDHVYASKIIRPNIAISWNTEGPNTLTLPSSLGTIQCLTGLDKTKMLVVVCSRGVAVVSGPGVDDTGAGAGWGLDILTGAPGAGEGSPRGAVATANGVVYQNQDGDLWLVTLSGDAVPISRPVRDQAVVSPAIPADVVLLTATPQTNEMVVANGLAGKLRVLDTETSQWATWNPNLGGVQCYLAAVNGVLWMQTSSASATLLAFEDFTTGTDVGTSPVVATLETGVLRPTNPTPHGWGRLRGVTLNEVRKSTDTQVSVNVKAFADQNDRQLMDKTRTTAPTNTGTFPGGGDGILEFRTTVQRCAYVRILMTITPAVFNAEGLDLWVANTGESSPSNNRS